MIKIAAFPNPSASRHWRLETPFKYLNRTGKFDARIIDGGIEESVIKWADIIILQGCVNKEGIALIHAYQQQHGKKLIVEQDDKIKVEKENPNLKHHEMTQASDVIEITMGIADMVTTTTKYLARRLQKINDNVVVLPNYLDMEVWDLEPKHMNTSDRLRIGWAGSLTHMEDLKSIAPVIRKILKDFPNTELVLVGEPRAAELFEGYRVECMLGVPFEAWPKKLHSLRLDIGIAPLRSTSFNKCKSNIKFLEYSIAKIPGVYSKTVYGYNKIEPRRGIIAYNKEQWYLALRNLVFSENLRHDIRSNCHSFVSSWFNIEREISAWEEAYKSLVA